MRFFIIHAIFVMTIMPIAIFLNRKLYHNLKNERHRENGKVIQRILKTYSIVQCTLPVLIYPLFLPIFIILEHKYEILEDLDPVLKYSFVQLLRCLSTIYFYYILSNSLIIALARYMFIVFDTTVNKIGTLNIQRFFIGLGIGIPIVLGPIHYSVIPFHTIDNFLRIGKYSLSNYTTSSDDNVTGCKETMFDSFESPLYCFTEKYFQSNLISVIRIVLQFVTAIIASNVPEGFIYIHTFIYCNR